MRLIFQEKTFQEGVKYKVVSLSNQTHSTVLVTVGSLLLSKLRRSLSLKWGGYLVEFLCGFA